MIYIKPITRLYSFEDDCNFYTNEYTANIYIDDDLKQINVGRIGYKSVSLSEASNENASFEELDLSLQEENWLGKTVDYDLDFLTTNFKRKTLIDNIDDIKNIVIIHSLLINKKYRNRNIGSNVLNIINEQYGSILLKSHSNRKQKQLNEFYLKNNFIYIKDNVFFKR